MAAGNEKTSRVPAEAKVAPRPVAAESPGGPGLEAEGKRRQSGAQKAAGNGDDAIEDASLAGREDADRGGS